MSILFFDTETNGFFQPGLDLYDTKQQHLVQLAAVLVDDAGNVVGQFKTLIHSDDFDIGEDAQRVHGISHEMCMKYGISLQDALHVFLGLYVPCDLLVAHNMNFDKRVIEDSLKRRYMSEWFKIEERFTFCTMLASMSHCKLPGGRRGEYKWPKLQEAYRHFFGKDFDGAHDALADVMACRDIYFKLKELEEANA